MSIQFLQPAWLCLLLAVPLPWFFPRRMAGGIQGVLRAAVMALLVLALARPALVVSNGKTYRVFVVDHSGSMSASQQARAEAGLDAARKELPADDPVSIVSMGDHPHATVSIGGVSASPLGAALRAAASQIPDGSRGEITVIGDGLPTDREWGSAVQSLERRGIPVRTLYIQPEPGDIYPAALHVEEPVRAGQTVAATVDVVGAAREFTVRLRGPDGELVRSAPLSGTGRMSVPLKFEAPAPGFMQVTAEVVPAAGTDTDRNNNALTRTIAVQDALRVLYVGARQQGGADKLPELLGSGFDVRAAGTQTLDAQFPLQDYDVVMIDDRPAKTLSNEFQRKLADAVHDQGLGLLFAGGKASFGEGGYRDTPVARALPVDILQREEKRDPSVSLAIIIDTSGSMAGLPLELAKQVALLTIHRLKPDDKVGIVEFYGAKQWSVPLQSASNRLEIDRAIGRMEAGGGTVLYPGIEEAYYGLKNMHTRYKHILLITDAGVEDADYEGMVRRVAKDGITLSSVLVGDGRYDDIMYNLASWGKGRYYAVADRYSLVELILKQLSTTRLPTYRTGRFELASHGGEGWWDAVDRRALPPLDAFVELDARPRAQVLIEASQRSQPVLASWQYGLGRVTALMTEPFGAGTNTWRHWPDYGKMLARVVSHTASDEESMHYALERDGTGVRIVARRESRDAGVLPAATLEPGGTAIQFSQRAPGWFEARVPASLREEVRVLTGAAGSHRRLISTPGDVIAGEMQVDPAGGLDLDRLADLTRANAASNGARRSLDLVALWPWLLALALLAYLSELIYRRRSRS